MSTIGNWVKRTFTSAIESMVPRSVKDRLIRHYSIPDIEWSLRNARDNGFSPAKVIDVGAYKGEWAHMTHRIFPTAKILMVEPQRNKQGKLASLTALTSEIEYKTALLGAEDGKEVSFYLNETVSSVLTEVASEPPQEEERTTVTLDTLTEETAFAKPDFLKLDVQGYELNVLRGARKLLDTHPPEMIQMEVSLIEVNQGAPLFAEVINVMDGLNYRLYDLTSFMRRPLDDALWQVDGLFVHADSDLVSSRRWG
jgi:FkbM family methyltransferase